MFEIILITVLAAFALGGIWAFAVTKKVKNEGIETDAVVSRVEVREWNGTIADHWADNNVTEDYYITYTDQEGCPVEALLSNPGDYTFVEGDRIRIRYLPDRKEYPVLVKIL